MTVSHAARASLGYGLVVLGIPAAITLSALAATAVVHTTAGIAAASVGAAFALSLGVLGRLHGSRVRLRTATWTSLGFGETRPRSLDEFKAAARDGAEVVGGGWGFFLQRRRPRAKRVFTHRFVGEEDWDGDSWWRAGTTIATVVKHYEKRKLTLHSTPTMQYISLGAWLALGNHGNGGSSGEPSSHAVEEVVVLDFRSGKLLRMNREAVRHHFDKELRRGPVFGSAVVLVRFNTNLMASSEEWVRKRCVLVEDPDSAAAWLQLGARLRVLFVGGARVGGLGIRWEAGSNVKDDAGLHVDPHFCQRWSMWFQSDVCSAVCGCNEPARAWNSKMRLVDANRWIPTLAPIFPLGALLLGIKNFEVVFPWPERNGIALWALVDQLHGLHRKIGGRSELRMGAEGPTTPVFLDVATRGGEGDFFALLSSMGVEKAALHPGKFDASDAGHKHLRLVPLGEIYYPGAV